MTVVAKSDTRPRGIALSPNGRTLYVSNADEHNIRALRGLGGFGVTGRIDQGNGGSASFAEVGIARGWFAVQREAQDLAYGLVRILGGGHALAVANSQE